jgi:hypothetical protein
MEGMEGAAEIPADKERERETTGATPAVQNADKGREKGKR